MTPRYFSRNKQISNTSLYSPFCKRFQTQTQRNESITSTITHERAKQLLNDIRTGKKFDSYCPPQLAVQECINIYSNIESETQKESADTANLFLSLLVHFGQTHKVYSFWNRMTATPHLSHPLLLKCCVSAKHRHYNTHQCIRVLQLMKDSQYKFKCANEATNHSKTVSKLIGKCTEYKALKSIESLTFEYSDIYNKTALITQFGKIATNQSRNNNCLNILDSAQKTFDSINEKDLTVLTVNTLMNAYFINKQYTLALTIYDSHKGMKGNNKLWHQLAVKACMHTHNKERAYSIIESVTETNPYFQIALIEFYAHFGQISKAKKIFNSVSASSNPINVAFIGAMMKALNANKEYTQTLLLYDTYQKSIASDDTITSLFAMRASRLSHDYGKGIEIHKNVIQSRVKQSVQLRNALIDFYAHFGEFDTAKRMYLTLVTDNIADASTVNTIMSALIQSKEYCEALNIYEWTELRLKNDLTHTLAIKACEKSHNFMIGKAIHNALKTKKTKLSQKLQNTLISFYGTFGEIWKAQTMFDQQRDTVSLNNIMRAFISNGQFESALQIYDKYEGILALDNISHLFAIKACAEGKHYEKGSLIHQKLLKQNINGTINTVKCANSLIDFYGKCGDINNAQIVFDSIVSQRKKVNSVSVNAIMTAYVNNGLPNKALQMYDRFKDLRDNISHTMAIKACVNSDNFKKGSEICHGLLSQTTKENKTDLITRIAMIDFFGNFGEIESAKNIFNAIGSAKSKDIICVNAMMDCYCMNDMSIDCIELFKNESLNDADSVTYAIVLKACTNSLSFEFGESVYTQMLSNPKLTHFLSDTQIQTNLILFFGKYGKFETVQQIFDSATINNKEESEIEIWNAAINVYGMNGDLEKVQNLTNEMINKYGMTLNYKTYAILINIYGHIGELSKCEQIWNRDLKDNPDIKYHKVVVSVMVDSLARSAQLTRAKEVILKYEKYHFHLSNHNSNNVYHEPMWSCLLSACYNHRSDKVFGEEIYSEMKRRFSQNKKRMKSASVIMNNIRSLP